jgi:Tfp pilus assembly protein PilF
MKNSSKRFFNTLAAGLGLVLLAGCANVAAVRKDQASAHFRMANSYLQQGRGIQDEVTRRRAYTELIKAIQLDGENARYRMMLGMIYMYNGELIAAEEELELAVSLDPDLGEAHNNLGTLYVKEGRHSEAVTEFKRAIANLSYQTPEVAYFNLGNASYRLGDYSQAGGAFEKVVEIVPNWAEAHYLLGRSYVKLGRLEDAQRSFSTSLDLDGDNVRANFELAVVLFKLNRKEASAKHFSRVVELEPNGELAAQAETFIKLLR